MQSTLAPETSFSAEKSTYQVALQEAESVLRLLSAFESAVQTAAQWCLEAFESGNKLLVLGNGGSACEAQHLVSELMGRYLSDRHQLPAVTLTADTAVLTCIGNDFSYEEVFARQLEGLGRPGDLLIAFSTSGNSRNVLRALETARVLGLRSIAFLGRDGGASAALSDRTTPRDRTHSGSA